MNKHTPGPWTACEMGVQADKCLSHGNFYVCSLIAPDNEEDKANARMLAAAPELLEALRDCVEYIANSRGDELPAIEERKAREALAKAQGV